MTSGKLPVSVIVLTHNEEANIAPCLLSIVGWAGELFVVDSGSSDRTLEIARQYTDKIVQHPFENYSRQRNWAQTNLPITHDWVFHMDADERVTPELAAALQERFGSEASSGMVAGFLIRRRIEFLGRHIRHGGIYPTYHCRVFRRAAGRCEDREYDQHFLVDGPTERIEADLTEVTATSLHSWTARHNRWAQMEAQHLMARAGEGGADLVVARLGGTPIERRRWLRASVYEQSPLFLRALAYFLVRYIFRGGFLDGSQGLIYHVLHGLWFRFYVDACYYELQHKKALK